MLDLESAIKHCEEVADSKCDECGAEHRQLAEWLKELKRLREQTRWIPVSERPPETVDEVIAYDGADAYANMGGFESSFEEQLSMIARHYGYKVQARQAIEEMAELTQAICKIQRYGFQDNYTDNLIEEIADVSIMVEQLKILVGSPSVTKKMKNKIARQIKRIIEEDKT